MNVEARGCETSGVGNDVVASITYHDLPSSFLELADGELLGRVDGCKKRIRMARNDFARYLPECARRGLHRRRGCRSLQQFAAMYAHMRPKHVRDVLHVWRGVQDKPALRALFLSGEQGWSKIRVVLKEATSETQVFWAEKIRTLSKQQLETLVRELRIEGCRQERLAGIQARLESLHHASKIQTADLAETLQVPENDESLEQLGGSFSSLAEDGSYEAPPVTDASVTRRGDPAGSQKHRTTSFTDPGRFPTGISDTADDSAVSSDDSAVSGDDSAVSSDDSAVSGDDLAPAKSGEKDSTRFLGENPRIRSHAECGTVETDEVSAMVGNDEGFRLLGGAAPSRQCPMVIDIAAMDQLQRCRLQLERKMGHAVSLSRTVLHLTEPDRSLLPIQTVLFQEEQTGLLFGRSQRGHFLTAAALYGRAWHDRKVISYEEEFRACESLLRSKEPEAKLASLQMPISRGVPGAASAEGSEIVLNGTTEAELNGTIEIEKHDDNPELGQRLPGETFAVASTDGGAKRKQPSRKLPRRVRRFLQLSCDERCTFPGCHRPVHSIHHSRRWALFHVHELPALHPLCREHDALVHGGGVIDEERPIDEWRIAGPRALDGGARARVDAIVQRHRMAVGVPESGLDESRTLESIRGSP